MKLSTLHIQLLGGFRLAYGDEVVTTLPPARQQALLAVLLLHQGAPQSRQQIAFRFWPDTSERQAQTNLRRELHHLRRTLPNPEQFIHVDGKSLWWRANAPFTLDLTEFEGMLAKAAEAQKTGRTTTQRSALEGAVNLYGGKLLPGCYDDWITPERERLEQRFLQALQQLIGLLETQRDYPAAIRQAQRLLHHDPLHEPAYHALMRLYALHGDRAAALRTYHSCTTILQRELGVEPNQETQTAYARLLQSTSLPALHSKVSTTVESASTLVGRQQEWQRLRTVWLKSIQGKAHFVLIWGEAGIGKSRLAEELLEVALAQGIKTARSRSYAAEGALAYAPVIEWLRSEAIRPRLTKLNEVWLTEIARLLPELLIDRPNLSHPEPLRDQWQRQRLFEALAHALLTDKHPTLLLMDDLQWCDLETLTWLRYLLRFAPQAPLLVVGTARTGEVQTDHPLSTLLLALRTDEQLHEIELGPLTAVETAQLAAQSASEELTPAAAQRIYQASEGNPLFVVEIVRSGFRGDQKTRRQGEEETKEQEEAENISLSPSLPLPLSSLPPKLHALIQGRLSQLSPGAREVAQMAATVGRAFSFAVLAQVSSMNEDALARTLEELWQRRLIREQSVTVYDFSHDRIREAAYAEISPIRRPLYHRNVAVALETLHAHNLGSVSAQIAAHYEEAGMAEKAVWYFEQASQAAERIYAYQEAVHQLNKALTLLRTLPEKAERAVQELDLLIALADAISTASGLAAPAFGRLLMEARPIALKLENRRQLFRVELNLRIFYAVRGEWTVALQYAERALALAQEVAEPVFIQQARLLLGATFFQLGRLLEARKEYDYAFAIFAERRARGQGDLGPDAGVLGRMSQVLWPLGYPKQAHDQIYDLLTWTRRTGQPPQLIFALNFTIDHHCYLGEAVLVQQYAEEAQSLVARFGVTLGGGINAANLGWAKAKQGQVDEGIALLKQGIAITQQTNTLIHLTSHRLQLVEVYLDARQIQAGLDLLAEAFAFTKQTGERVWNAELHRFQGELLLLQGAPALEVEACYTQALTLARQQGAKSFELRAAMSLSRLWQREGRRAEARQLLTEIYEWFTEGFDTADLQEAHALLQELSSRGSAS